MINFFLSYFLFTIQRRIQGSDHNTGQYTKHWYWSQVVFEKLPSTQVAKKAIFFLYFERYVSRREKKKASICLDHRHVRPFDSSSTHCLSLCFFLLGYGVITLFHISSYTFCLQNKTNAKECSSRTQGTLPFCLIKTQSQLITLSSLSATVLMLVIKTMTAHSEI